MTTRRTRRERRGETAVDRAVTEVLAFVLVFSIVIGSVTLLYMTGFTAMTTVQEGEQTRNAERAMSALSNNINDVLRHDGVEERNGELQLRDGKIGVDEDGTELTVEVGGPVGTVYDDAIGSLTYEHSSTKLAYEGGAVFRDEGSGNVAVTDPKMRCDQNDVAIVSILVIEGSERTVQSSGSAELEAVKQSTTVVTRTDLGENVTVTVDSDYESGWGRALERSNWNDGPGNTYTCESVDRVTVRIVVVDVSIST